jgi:membrane fusion protein, multidrug efflux system
MWQRWGFFGVLLLGIGLMLVPKFVLTGRDAAPTGRPAGGRPPLMVRTEKVQPGLLEERLLLTGDLVADDGVSVRAEVSGKIVGIHFEEGSQVRSGQLLLKIRDDDLQAQLRSALKDLELAQIQERRQARLLGSQSTTQEAFDEARVRREKLEAEVDLIRARIDRTEVRAPFDGRIGLRQVSVGALIDPSIVVATLQTTHALKVDFAVPERYLGAIRTGLALQLRVSGVDRAFKATIDAIEPRIDAATRSILCRARIEDAAGLLLPGGFASIELTLSSNPLALLIPTVALIPDLARTTVYVVENGVAMERLVQIGQRTEHQIEIVSGIRTGEEVVIAGLQGLRPGATVQVLN